MNKKFELTDNYIEEKGQKLYQIRALRDIEDADRHIKISKGTLGGWVWGEDAVDQECSCWAYDDCKIFDGCRITGNTLLIDGSILTDKVFISGDSYISSCELAGEMYISASEMFGCFIVSNNEVDIDNSDLAFVKLVDNADSKLLPGIRLCHCELRG